MDTASSSVETFETPVATINEMLFNHDIMNCTSEEVTGNYLYSGRALGLTVPGDIIQLHAELEKEWVYITRHYDNIGLTFTRSVLWNTDYQILPKYSQYRPSFFYYGEDIYDNYVNDDFYNIVEFINSKNNFMRVAQELNLPIPQTFCYSSKSLIIDSAMFPYPCYLKAAISVSGVGIYRCENETELFNALNTFDNRVPIQIQEEVTALSFLNVQYIVNSKGVERFAATDQLLDGFAHKGNQHPTKFPCWHVTDPYADYLYKSGIEGIFAFDVAVIDKTNKIDYRLIECNPRFNGASYPTWIAKKLGVENWTAEAFSTNIRSLAKLDLSGIEFSAESGRGVVLVNWGPILVGKISVLIIGSPEQQNKLRNELVQRL